MAMKYLFKNSEISEYNYISLQILIYMSKRLESISDVDIYNLLKKGFSYIPVPIYHLPKGLTTDRIRVNNKERLFNNISELGYIKDKSILNKMNYFGRANLPRQSMFYASIKSSNISYERLTAIAETTNCVLDKESIDLEGKLLTLSRWELQSSIPVLQMVFSKEALKNNQEVKKAFDTQVQHISKINNIDKQFCNEFLAFISDEFAKIVTDSFEYKISAIFTQIILEEHPKVKGIMFPSVQTVYQGFNVVFPIKTVDEYLKPILCGVFKLYKNGLQVLLENRGYYSRSIKGDGTILWSKEEGNLISREAILKKLQVVI